MNDLELLKDHGPSPTVLHGETLRRARAALLAEIAVPAQREHAEVVPAQRLAPKGWTATHYKADRTVTYRADGDADGPELTVSLLDAASTDLRRDYDARDVAAVRVHGRSAALGRFAGGWVVEARTPAGQAYSVLAPATFTREQVVQVANGVTYRS